MTILIDMIKIIGDSSFLILYPFYSIALFVITLIIIELLNLLTLFNKIEYPLTEYEYIFLKEEFKLKKVLSSAIDTLLQAGYIKIDGEILTTTNIVVDTQSFNNIMLSKVYEKAQEQKFSYNDILNDNDFNALFNKLKYLTKKGLIKKSLLKSSNYIYSFLIFIPISLPGVLKLFNTNSTFNIIILIEIVSILLLFIWILYSNINDKTQLGKKAMKKYKQNK